MQGSGTRNLEPQRMRNILQLHIIYKKGTYQVEINLSVKIMKTSIWISWSKGALRGDGSGDLKTAMDC